MNKKVVIIGVIVLVIILIIILLWTSKAPDYPTDPADWIIPKITGEKEVFVEYVTAGGGYLTPGEQQYKDEYTGISTVFAYDGFYLGDYFYGNSYYNSNMSLKMGITSDLDPDNGVIEGIIVMKINNENDVEAFIFVDEDWKKQIGDRTNIIWGRDYEYITKFQFNKIKDGVYMYRIKDDASRFEDHFKVSNGGIVVGSISFQELENNELDNAIFMRAI